MFHHFLFDNVPDKPYSLSVTRPFASRVYLRAMQHPCPILGVLAQATSTWKWERSKHQHFYGHSYTYTRPPPKNMPYSNSVLITPMQLLCTSVMSRIGNLLNLLLLLKTMVMTLT